MWWKQYKKILILAAAILALLGLAFWYGGNSAGSRGWQAAPRQQLQAEAQQPVDAAASDSTVELPDKAPQLEGEELSEKLPDPLPEPAEQTESGLAKESPDMTTNPETGKDQYLTDPVPAGKPLPVEPQDNVPGSIAYTCTLSISCATILDNMDLLYADKAELVPADGVILATTSITFYAGESVFNVLQRTCKQKGIHMEFANTPIYNSAYIEGIHNLYEFDVGELSGWMYRVNGWFPNYGCSRYQLQDGDVIEWLYTCDLGYDIGGGYATGGGQKDE